MTRILTVSLAMLAGLCTAAFAADRPAGRTIAVSGTVETRTAPDQVVWNISLTDADKNLQAAKTRSDERAKTVVALRQKLGLAEGDLQTGLVNVYREYERDQHGSRGAFKHFAISRSVTIWQRDLKRFDEFLDKLLGSTDMEVSFHFDSSRVREVRAETRLKALRVAREKAEAMAGALGAKLGPVVTIEEAQRREPWSNFASNTAVLESRPAADVASDKFVPGAIDVTVTVHVTFALQ
jgi:uncharacterized protein YggE